MVLAVNKDLYIIKKDSKYRGCEEMHAHQALRILVLVFILTAGSVFPALVSTPVTAQSTQQNTTLYFTNALNFFTDENFSDFSFTSISVNPPTSQNDSRYPPNLIEMNTSKLFGPKLSTQWTTWFTSTWLLYFLSGTEGFNLSDLFDYFGNGTFAGYDFTLLLPNPFRVVESYSYDGEEPITISGDLTFNLFFSPPRNTLAKYRDNVTVGLYSINMNSFLPLPKLIQNRTITLAPKGQSIYSQLVTLENVSVTLSPGSSLLFTVEIKEKNKGLPTFLSKVFDISRILNRINKIASRWENRSKLPTIQTIGASLKELLTALSESGINITSQDVAELLSSRVSSQFVYDSLLHPSSVTVPSKISEEDFRVYYLHADKTMSEEQFAVTNTSKSKTNLAKNETIWTTDEGLERNKMLAVGNTTLEIYLSKLLFLIRPSLTLTATLYDEGVAITSAEKKVTFKDIKPLIGKPKKPVIILFNDSSTEIAYGHHLGVGISINKKYLLSRLTVPKLLSDSTTYSSFLRVKYEETHNIQVDDVTVTPESAMIVPGGSIEYLLAISSKKADNLTISTIVRENTGSWEVTAPTTVSVRDNSITSIPVFINSTDKHKVAYGNRFDTTLVITGRTGIARTSASAEVSKDVIRYDIILLDYQHNITMKKGETRTLHFTIKNNNTGALDDVDNYTVDAISQNGWRVIPRESIKNVVRGETSIPDDARVVIEVPANTTLDSDVVTVTVTSDSDPSISASIIVTVNLQPPDIFQSIYDSLNSAAKSLGLADIFGENAGVALAGLLTIIILFIIIILAFVLTLKDVDIICTHRINEIEPDQQAFFELSLRNPTRKPQSYDVTTEHTGEPSQWTVTSEPATLQVEGRQKQPVRIIATPAETIIPKDWTEITVCVQRTGKKKTAHIDLMAMIKEGKTVLQIGNVTHWPSEFAPGDRVVTSFSVSNKGTIVARDVTVFFYLNGKQKNKITATIPAGAVADVQMPWIAVKGKNKVRIRLKEQ